MGTRGNYVQTEISKQHGFDSGVRSFACSPENTAVRWRTAIYTHYLNAASDSIFQSNHPKHEQQHQSNHGHKRNQLQAARTLLESGGCFSQRNSATESN